MTAATASSTITGSHPYADKFPMMSADAFAELIESVRANGLRYPVVATPDGQILDGRNRYAACLELGIEPDIEIYDRDDLAEYVIDCNSSRRHMSTGARAMATALVLAADGRRENGRWKRDSVQIGNGLESTSGWPKPPPVRRSGRRWTSATRCRRSVSRSRAGSDRGASLRQGVRMTTGLSHVGRDG